MGRPGAEAMAEQDVPLESALVWHLTSNHYPPVPFMIAPCLEAVNQVNETGDYNTPIELPDGVVWMGNLRTCPPYAIINDFHLEPWIDDEGEL